ncbi:hypothetical protein B9Z55_022236 [Caenorhabditis nigoni]|uniref:RING-type domain-containing protein n=2 Tax=Caenorhabditis nigoni TaxID=1611254 RepID=A0A2G5SJV5_9PELO|nr:hypothetical protein B9Z55_022236 [Caenorhabditis nigoni]
MDPQLPIDDSRESSPRTRSISAHFPQLATAIQMPYADGIHTLFENAMNNVEFQNQSSSSSNRNFEENHESPDHSRIERDMLLDQHHFRHGLEHIRNRLETQHGQSVITFLKNVLPFLALFVAKLTYDHMYDIFQFGVLFVAFYLSNQINQRIMEGGFTNKFFQIIYCFASSMITAVYLRSYSLVDFDFSNTFGLNVLYFMSGEYKELTMSSTFYGVIMTDTSFKLITLIPKSLILVIPDAYTSSSFKRKLLQTVEYCSQMYRCALPFGPWLRYFLFVTPGSGFMINIFCFVYFSLKIGEVYRYSLSVKKSVRCLLTVSSFGTVVKVHELEEQQCTVCHEGLTYPIRLECSHVFCKSCIETWLDQKITCPMCRAEVIKDVDNDWKNGETSKWIRAF